MRDGQLLVLTGPEVGSLVIGLEERVISIVRNAYECHRRGESSLPPSSFLRLPGDPADRIIALPACLGGDAPVAGIKWIASVPANVDRGMERASAVMILSSTTTGRPMAVMEGSIVSAWRTAASAALAASVLHRGESVDSVGVVGCGLINLTIVRFLGVVFPSIRRIRVYDVRPDRAERFAVACGWRIPNVEVEVVPDVSTVLRGSRCVSFATSGTEPYVTDVSGMASDATILHVSLRDLAPEVILRCDNVVDDIDHVCRANTSIHLTEQRSGGRAFIRCTLADITTGDAPARRDESSVAVFSPFGLGVLDLAVAHFVFVQAIATGVGTWIDSFLPAPQLASTTQEVA